MYIAKIHIQNYRCFKEQSVEFQPGVNVIIGENNAGKTALLKALGLIFNRRNRRIGSIYDFYQGINNFSEPPAITVSLTLQSSEQDRIKDKALVATWLTKLSIPWEATLTYKFLLPERDTVDFQKEINSTTSKEQFWNVVERYLPKYVSRIYGGNPDANNQAEPEALNRFDYQFLDAIRDVESELFSGSNPLMKAMLMQVLDRDVKDNEAKRNQRQQEFRELANPLQTHLKKRLDVDTLFNLVEETGAKDGGQPELSGEISEHDLMAALKLFIRPQDFDFSLPANYNGLGYNNLVYISLVLASLDFKSSVKNLGENALLFPMLLIEEPEAHLHPALQYKLLKYIQKRVRQGQSSRQVFITTHSTHITAASGLDPIICMSAANKEHGVHLSYPGRAFPDTAEGKKSKKYVERYLDATKSNMLFVKGVIFVEGLAEQLLIPCFAEYMDSSLENHHVAVIAVGGSTFKHFVPIFGAVLPIEKQAYALRRRVACLIDADPMRKKKEKNARRKKCWHYQIGQQPENYEYYPLSSALSKLKELCKEASHISIYHGTKTLEYDIAECNSFSTILITPSCTHHKHLHYFANKKTNIPPILEKKLLAEKYGQPRDALKTITDIDKRRNFEFSTCYLICVDESKGEHAFDFESQLRENIEKPEEEREAFEVPEHIKKAIWWACGIEPKGAKS